MPKFLIVNNEGFFDGVKMHPRGTVVIIDPRDYKRLLGRTMEGVDEEGRKAIAQIRKDTGYVKPAPAPKAEKGVEVKGAKAVGRVDLDPKTAETKLEDTALTLETAGL